MAEEFRQRHNRSLSPGYREDNRRKLWEENFLYKTTYDPAVTVTADMISDDPEELDTHIESLLFECVF